MAERIRTDSRVNTEEYYIKYVERSKVLGLPVRTIRTNQENGSILKENSSINEPTVHNSKVFCFFFI